MSRVVKDIVRTPRRWFEAKRLAEAAESVDLGQALADASRLSLAYLTRALVAPDSRVSPKDKVQIALALAPRLAIERRGRPRKAVAGEALGDADLAPLLEGYGVNTTIRTG